MRNTAHALLGLALLAGVGSTLALAKVPSGKCAAGFEASATSKGRYTCSSARPQCGKGHAVEGVRYNAAKKQLVYSCTKSTSATVLRPATTIPEAGQKEEPFYTIELAKGYVRSIRRRELQTKIDNPEVRAAALRAYDALHRLARGRRTRDHQHLSILNRTVDQKYDDLMLAAEGSRHQLCVGKCNKDRLKCKKDCKKQGKTLCGCGATAVACFAASLVPGGGC